MGICVKSEIGKLKRVMLHRPGKELEKLIPGFSLEYCHMITLDATEMRFSGHEMEEARVELTPEDPEFDQLLALLEGRTYRPPLSAVCWSGTDTGLRTGRWATSAGR